MNEKINLLSAVINTIEGVSVAGHENWDRMAGCYSALESLKKTMISEADQADHKEPEAENG